MTSKAWNSEAELLASDVERLMTRGHIQIIGHDIRFEKSVFLD
jgi:hypothetical protein